MKMKSADQMYREITNTSKVKFTDFDTLEGKTLYVTTNVTGGMGFKTMGIAASGFLATVEKETEKAVQLRSNSDNGKSYTAWFPKKAMVQLERDNEFGTLSCDLAKWFIPSGWTAKFINLVESTGFVAA